MSSRARGSSDEQAPSGDTAVDARSDDDDQPAGWHIRLRALWRLLVVTWQFLPLALSWWRDRKRFFLFGSGRDPSSETRTERAEDLLATLLELGPTFIKLGQMLSTRPDILPAEYITVLSRLQDEVPPADWAQIRPVIESELGPVEEVFDDFDREAISGASLGQVYTAELDGERVAVKVLRPDIRERVEADLRVLSVLLPAVVKVSPEGSAFTLENLAEEFAATIRNEMDYAYEARTLQTIKSNFAADPKIRIPSLRAGYSTDRVLTMEYVDGMKITDVEALEAAGVDRHDLVVRLNNAYIQMIVEDGLFHADPHPGNLAVKPDGTLVFYDFGMSGQLDEHARDQLFECYVGLAEDDIDRVIDAFIALDSLDPTADREVVRQLFSVAIDSFRGEDISDYRMDQLFDEFQGRMQEFPMRLPRNMALVVRVSSVMEGVCRTLEPDFDFISVVSEYIKDQRTSEENLGRVSEEVTTRVRDLEGSARRVPVKLDRVLTAIDRESLTVSMLVEEDNGLLRRFFKQVTLGTVTSLALLGTTTLYAVGYPLWAVAMLALALWAGAATRWSFRKKRSSLDIRSGMEMAERSLDQRRRQMAEHRMGESEESMGAAVESS